MSENTQTEKRTTKRSNEEWKKISQDVAEHHGLSPEFNQAVQDELQNLPSPSWENRTDLTDIPFVTIDAITTTDMDDAMFAQPDGKGGWHIIVAIADPSQYIQWGSEIDKEARRRGNTYYLPGHTCHMIPNELASDRCSLVPDVKRSCLAMHMWVNAEGELTQTKLQRGVMKSRAKLHHDQVEDAMKGNPDDDIKPHMQHIENIYKAYEPLKKAAETRGQLFIARQEQKICFDANNKYKGIKMSDYMDINKVIEQFMVMANVAAAKMLNANGFPGVFRTHEKASQKILSERGQVLKSLGYAFDPKKPLRKQLNHILAKSLGKEEQELIHFNAIRMGKRALYSPDKNIGHYALGLDHYAHFTSPIRRYADLMVHRLLIEACELGEDGLSQTFKKEVLEGVANNLARTEHKAKRAESDARKGFAAAWAEEELMDIEKNNLPRVYGATITGFSPEGGLKVKLTENGVQGVIPLDNLPGSAYKQLKSLSAIGTRIEAANENGDKPSHYTVAYQVAAKINVEITEVDLEENIITFKPTDHKSAVMETYKKEIANGLDKRYTSRLDKKKRKQAKKQGFKP